MKRTGFARKPYTPPPAAPLRALERPVNAARISANDPAPAVEKENPLVCEAYRSLVRAMACAHCGHPPRSQFCHSDQGKGLGLKTDDRRGWPGCGPHGTEPGCHWLLGSSGRLGKEVRRALEDRYASQTRAAILAAGKWPNNLPRWTEK
jgi:hypothetical protein